MNYIQLFLTLVLGYCETTSKLASVTPSSRLCNPSRTGATRDKEYDLPSRVGRHETGILSHQRFQRHRRRYPRLNRRTTKWENSWFRIRRISQRARKERSILRKQSQRLGNLPAQLDQYHHHTAYWRKYRRSPEYDWPRSCRVFT
jgi:hypothetical protein